MSPPQRIHGMTTTSDRSTASLEVKSRDSVFKRHLDWIKSQFVCDGNLGVLLHDTKEAVANPVLRWTVLLP